MSVPEPQAAAVTMPRTTHAPGIADYPQLVGLAGWRRLAPDIRRRFAEHPDAVRTIRYSGVMERVGGSWLGAVFAQFCRLLGTPFAPWRARDVPVAITLKQDPLGGTVWEREYRYAGRAPITVRSSRRQDADGALRECVAHGFGMRLAVFEANRALHFLSLRYFWRIGGRELLLPELLSPGTAHVIHEDLGDGSFRFSMTVHHRWFGLLFDQTGVFRQEAAAPGVRA
ncbi:MAG: DUF4166 domain-containing protein [Solimonas sp.]